MKRKIGPLYVVNHPKKDGTYPVGKVGGHVMCFAPTLSKARHVAHALNKYKLLGFDWNDGEAERKEPHD